jgi:hypothetical protein
MRREKSLRIGVHHANAVVWGPVRGTRLGELLRERGQARGAEQAVQEPGVAAGDGPPPRRFASDPGLHDDATRAELASDVVGVAAVGPVHRRKRRGVVVVAIRTVGIRTVGIRTVVSSASAAAALISSPRRRQRVRGGRAQTPALALQREPPQQRVRDTFLLRGV